MLESKTSSILSKLFTIIIPTLATYLLGDMVTS